MRIWTLAAIAWIVFSGKTMAQEIQSLDQQAVQYQVMKGEPTKTEGLVLKCYDLALSGLDKEAKKLIIEEIYDSTKKSEEPYLRFALGQICYELEEYEGAKYQWNIVYSKFPYSEEAEAVKIIFSALEWSFENWEMDQKFRQEYELSNLFWSRTKPDLRINLEELLDPVLALNYLQELYKRYSDETKRAILLYDQFMLIMGYNQNDLGYHNMGFVGNDQDSWDTSTDFYKEIKAGKYKVFLLSDDFVEKLIERNKPREFYFSWASALSDSLNTLGCGRPYYVKTQFLLGISKCGSKIFSNKIKVKAEAKPFFQNIINATESDETNIYRLFAIKWLSEAQ
jgi:hypothetical protein